VASITCCRRNCRLSSSCYRFPDAAAAAAAAAGNDDDDIFSQDAVFCSKI
jgi:hypothetical protein